MLKLQQKSRKRKKKNWVKLRPVNNQFVTFYVFLFVCFAYLWKQVNFEAVAKFLVL